MSEARAQGRMSQGHQHAINPPVQNNDAGFDEYMREKRGWMMMVSALFVQLAFQAAMQPPTWIPADWYRQHRFYRSKPGAAPAPATITSAPSPCSPPYAAAESPAAAISLTKEQAHRAYGYVLTNTVTFATALTILVSLMLVNRSSGRRTIIYVQWMSVLLAMTCAATYAFANSHETGLMKWVLTIIAIYAILTFLMCFTPFIVQSLLYCFVTVPRRVTRRLFGR